MGDATEAQTIAQRYAPHIQCLLDNDTQSTYQRYGVGKATLSAMIAPEVWRDAITTVRTYGVGSAHGGDVSQLPATFVITPTGQFTLAYYSRSIADYPTDAVILDALQGVPT